MQADNPQPARWSRITSPRTKALPAERPIRIKLPALDPSLYRLEVSATLPNGNPVALEPILIDTSDR